MNIMIHCVYGFRSAPFVPRIVFERKTLHTHKRSLAHARCWGSSPDKNTPISTPDSVGLGLKSAWVAAEALGNVVGLTKGPNDSQPGTSASVLLTREEAIELIKQDYEVEYFVSGKGNLAAIDPNCYFADNFASFTGKERFRRNVQNLGGMLKDVELVITDWKITENGDLQTKWRFNSILEFFPWRPRLAAAGSTLHVLDPETNLVIKHIETWDVEPSKVVLSLFKPSSKVPTNNWDVLLLSLLDGDYTGVWLASSTNIAKLTSLVLVISIISKIFTGEGLDVWPLAAVGLVSALVTEALKISGGLQGGETGTGGRF